MGALHPVFCYTRTFIPASDLLQREEARGRRLASVQSGGWQGVRWWVGLIVVLEAKVGVETVCFLKVRLVLVELDVDGSGASFVFSIDLGSLHVLVLLASDV